MRLGEVHGAGPFAGHHLGQVGALQLLAALRLERVDGAVGQQRAQAEGEVGRIPDLAGGGRHDLRQVLAAPLLRSGRARSSRPRRIGRRLPSSRAG